MSTINLQVGASGDDAHERRNSSAADITNVILTLRNSFTLSRIRDMGARFNSVGIGQADTIDSATWSLFVDSTANDDPDTVIHAEDVDDAAIFIASDGSVSNRVPTTASVTWEAVNIGTGFKNGGEVKALIQEVVDRGSWVSNNDLVMLSFPDNAEDAILLIRSYDNEPTEAPKLDITFTAVVSRRVFVVS